MRKIRADEIPIIEKYLGVKLDLSSGAVIDNVRALKTVANVMRNEAAMALGDKKQIKIPVYDDKGNIIDRALKHPYQSHSNGIAVYIGSEDMVPRYFLGEMVYVQRGRPPELNKDCWIELNNGVNIIANFLGYSDKCVKVLKFNPKEEIFIDKEDIKHLSAVVGRN